MRKDTWLKCWNLSMCHVICNQFLALRLILSGMMTVPLTKKGRKQINKMMNLGKNIYIMLNMSPPNVQCHTITIHLHPHGFPGGGETHSRYLAAAQSSRIARSLDPVPTESLCLEKRFVSTHWINVLTP